MFDGLGYPVLLDINGDSLKDIIVSATANDGPDNFKSIAGLFMSFWETISSGLVQSPNGVD
jgi:hypothetical protein